jgi:hypothetical protein
VIETAARGAQFLLAIGIAYLIAMWFALAAWTFRDIEARSRSVFTQVFSTLLVVLFFVPGLLLYLILRPKDTLDQTFQRALEEEYLLQDLDDLPLCSGCQRAVDPEFLLCPHCRTRLRGPCPACSRLIDLRWDVCPYCAVPVDRESLGGGASGGDGIRVLEEARAGRRQRAVAAAAQRVGIEGDELDALTDALSGAASPVAVGAGNSHAPASGASLSRRVAAIGDFSRLRGRARVGEDQDRTAADEASPNGASDAQRIGAAANGGAANSGEDGFWADPLPGLERGREHVTETPS